MHKMRNDLILIGSILLVAIIGLIIYYSIASMKKDLTLYIYDNQKLVETCDLNVNKQVEVNGVVIVIENGQVYVLKSTCKDKICVYQGKINKAGQTIVCLPNRVYIKLEGKEVDVGI